MYVTVRHYAGGGRQIAEIARRVQQGLVPRLKAMPGFRGYCAFGSEDGAAVSVSLFDDRSSALAANDAARGWVADNLRDLLPDPPEVAAGTCALHETTPAHGQSGGPLHVVVRRYDHVGPEQQVLEAGRRQVLPALTGAPGFRGYYLAWHEADRSRLTSVTLFAGREQAMRAHEQVQALVRDTMRELVPNPPRVLSGQTVVLATAEPGPAPTR